MLFFKKNGNVGGTVKKTDCRLNAYQDNYVWEQILREFRALPKERRDEIFYLIFKRISQRGRASV